jgi:hypothetical protein
MMTDPRAFFTLASDETITIGSVVSLNEEAVLVSYSSSDLEWEDTLPSTNVYIASFVTCHARLRLYEQLEQLGDRACYMDTGTEYPPWHWNYSCFSDSLFYTWKPGEYEIPTGPFLGQWADEILKDYGAEAKLIKFVSTGPKSYAYRVQKANGEISDTVKSKGFSLDVATGRIITLDTMERLVDKFVLEGEREKVIVNSTGIRREKNHEVVTVSVPKKFQYTFRKRRVVGNYMTEEFGYLKE